MHEVTHQSNVPLIQHNTLNSLRKLDAIKAELENTTDDMILKAYDDVVEEFGKSLGGTSLIVIATK